MKKSYAFPGKVILIMGMLITAGAVPLVVAGAEIEPLKEITGKGVDGKSIDQVTDADIQKVTPYPGQEWQVLKGEKKDFGNWLSVYQLEAAYHDCWDPVRSPEDFKTFEHMGVDAITAHIDGSGNGSYAPRPLYIQKPEDVGLMHPRWVLQTGRGIIPAMMSPAANASDGLVFYTPTYDARRQSDAWCSNCYSSPRTIEDYIARLRGNMNALRELATWNGKPLVMFLKEEGKWMYPKVRDDGTIQWGCYCSYCVDGYRKFLKKRFVTIKELNQAIQMKSVTIPMAGYSPVEHPTPAVKMKYQSFDEVLPPPFEMRFQMPVLFHYWMQYREWVRLEVIDKLVRRCGALNVQCDSTFQLGMWYHGVESGYNPHLGAMANDIVNVDMTDGSLWGVTIGVAATVDAVLREHPEKRALALWGGYPPEEGIHPTLFHRRIAEMFGHVTSLRGSMFFWWDLPGYNKMAGEATYHNQMRYYPEMADAYAWWAAFGENQAELIAGMKTAMPGIASYWARTQTAFETQFPPHMRRSWIFTERSKFWNWNFLAFWLDQNPVHCLFPEQVEAGAANNYKVLYTLYGPRNTDAALDKIKTFYAAGGFVYGAYDALTMNISGSRMDVFKAVFGCEPAPGGVVAKPIYNLPGDFDAPKGYYEITRAHPALPPVGTRIPFMSGIQVVKPLADAEVYATYEGKPCIVGTARSLFVGTDIAVDLATMLPPDLRPATDEPGIISAKGTTGKGYQNAVKVLTGFASYAGVRRPVTVTRAGETGLNVIVGLLEKPGARLITLTENQGKEGTYEMSVEAGVGEKVWDLTRAKALEKGTSGNYRLNLDGYDWRLILVADEKTVAAATRKQEEVERQGKSQPYRLTRNFFVRSEDHGRHPDNNHYIHKPEDVYLPAAVIVIPDKLSAAVDGKVKEIQELIRNLSRKEIASDLVETTTDTGATLPIIRVGKLDANACKEKNVLFIGSGLLNPQSAKWAADEGAARKIRDGRITTVQKHPWRSGGNVMVIPGENEAQLLKNLAQFQDDLVVWFNGKRCPVPVQYLATALQRFTESLGWTVMPKGPDCIDIKRPDGKQTTCWIYSRYDENFEPIVKELTLRSADEPMVVYGYGNGLAQFKKKLTTEGWKSAKSGEWMKGEKLLRFSTTTTDGSLNTFMKGMWPEEK